MSYSYSHETRRRRPAGTGFSASGRRTALGYWVPLAVTVTVATIGLAAWIWSERNDDDEDDGGYGEYREGDDLPPGYESVPPGAPIPEYARTTSTDLRDQDNAGMMARMQGALRRTPSPQQIFDGASRRVVAGVAAAGAMVGGALTSIREEGRGDFEDHSRWSEEVDARDNLVSQATATGPAMSGALPTRTVDASSSLGKRKKTVAIVVSSESSDDSEDAVSEHASILSHLPEHVDPDTTRVFVLIYAPGLKSSVGGQNSLSRSAPSIASSYSNIAPEEATASGELPEADMSTVEPKATDEFEGATPFFTTLYRQAQTLVDKETMIMPFSTRTGHVHLIRHLSPDLVYIQESLTGNEGDAVHHISGWVRQVVVVVGDEGGRGGLIDSDDESALGEKSERWWQKEGVTGLGKRIDVVDVLRTGDDWRRRVSGQD
ncbi:hypothetical protein Plec18167_003740 [Paecilomyces lecythidis]|uniref:Peroxin 22-like protein n=1 Tax=Paecilomyces lecythidis TaxID=3004212 RepID=A0ABR3XWF1_9EURO